METEQEEARRKFEEKHQLNCNFYLVDELNRMKSELQKKRDQENAPEENVNIFDQNFAEQIRKIKSRISEITGENTVSQCEDLKNQVSICSDYLNRSVHFLNSYTILQAQQKIAKMTEEINAAQSSFAPRKKFAFSNRNVKKPMPVEPELVLTEISMVHEGIQDQNGLNVTKTDAELKDFNCYQLKNLTNSKIFLLGRLKAVHILNLQNCEVFIGPVSGAAHITECVNCVIHVAAHQIRIHQSSNTDFYIFVSTNPIVENVQNVRFAPYNVKYKGIEEHMHLNLLQGENNWDQVQDFKWLKQEKSPNWDVIEETQRVQVDLD